MLLIVQRTVINKIIFRERHMKNTSNTHQSESRSELPALK